MTVCSRSLQLARLRRLAGTAVLLAVAGSGAAGPVPPKAPLDVPIATPVRAVRTWTSAIAPNKRGGWNFITQSYELDSGAPSEFIVLDLATGKVNRTEGPAERIANSGYQIGEQLRAANGRVFFPEADNWIAYYDPDTETVKELGRVVPAGAPDKVIFRMVFGRDGKLYGGTESNGLPTIIQLDPDTLKTRVLGHVGKTRYGFSYAYYVAVDPPWVYVAVGENPWELSALNIDTGESRILATRPANGFIQLDTRPEGITATLISNLRTAQQITDRVWCIDGKSVPFDASYEPSKLSFKPRDIRPHDGKLSASPEVEHNPPGADGVGRVRWRLAPKDGWSESSYRVKNTAAIDIESLVALPDGTLLGNAKQYHSFFRFRPQTSSVELLQPLGISGGPRVVADGQLFLTGYPNGVLYEYDPTKSWAPERSRAAALNPRPLGTFTAAGAHFPYFLVRSTLGRLFYAGRRERDGIGSGVGYYDLKSGAFGGHHDGLSILDPQGLVVLDDLEMVVFSGRLHDDPEHPNLKPREAQLVVYDQNLKERQRETVKPNLGNTGLIFATTKKGVVVGVAAGEHAIYTYDVVRHKLLAWKQVVAPIGPCTQRTSDLTLWILADDTLLRIDSSTASVTEIGKVSKKSQPSDLLVWDQDHLYWAAGPEIREIRLPR